MISELDEHDLMDIFENHPGRINLLQHMGFLANQNAALNVEPVEEPEPLEQRYFKQDLPEEVKRSP